MPDADPPYRLLRRHLDHWTSVRNVKEGETANVIFTFLGAEPKAGPASSNTGAMPVNLTTVDEVETWMTATPKPLSCRGR
jgi:hypothetical protein